jgi:hypothetical protein
VYNRYGDVVELYVYDRSGDQIASTTNEGRPPIGGYETWTVSAELNSSSALPARCVAAAQPTHPFQRGPSR